jgi:hypothetical protein
MKFLFVLFLWFVMAGLLISGVVLAVQGTFWLLIVGAIGFILAVGKIGCLTH